jgi:hypothetical protein
MLGERFTYAADMAEECDLSLSGQAGFELEVRAAGFAVASWGYDLDFLPRAEGVLTDPEAKQIQDLGNSWSSESEAVPWAALARVCAERLIFGAKVFAWNRHTELVPAPVLALRDAAYRITQRLKVARGTETLRQIEFTPMQR